MSLKYKGEIVTINNKEYNILFTVNVIDNLEEHFKESISAESLKKWLFKDKNIINYHNLALILWTLVSENVEIKRFNKEECEDVQLEEVRMEINTVNADEYLVKIITAFLGSFKMGEEDCPNK